MRRAAAIARARRSAPWPKCSAAACPTATEQLARELIEAVLPTLADLRSLRAQAYVVLAWGHLWMQASSDIEPLENVAWSAARRLVECYQRSLRPDWQWFESRMTYANAVLPHALFIAARRWPQENFLEIGRSIVCLPRPAPRRPPACFLAGRQRGLVSPRRGEGRSTINSRWKRSRWPKPPWPRSICSATSEYLATFRRAHGWFHGRNSLKQPLVDVRYGACCDGLQASRRESQPRCGIDAGLLVDRNAQHGTPAEARTPSVGRGRDRVNSVQRNPRSR